MPTSQLDARIDRLCEDLIAEKWGDLNAFPDELRQAVFAVYRSFIAGYLNFLQQKETKAADWFPEKLVIDWELVDGMRHFFSDYQHMTRAFLGVNRQLEELCDIDGGKQPGLYRHLISKILAWTA